MNINTGHNAEYNTDNIEAALQMLLCFTDSLALQTELGFKLGQGALFGELRIGGDTDYVSAGGASQYQRSILLSLSVGYRIGFIDR
jgi:hypothetical protein